MFLFETRKRVVYFGKTSRPTRQDINIEYVFKIFYAESDWPIYMSQ